METEYTAFYDMVKEWTINDYCNPGIKSEVILDMLISDFVEELIQHHYVEKFIQHQYKEEIE